MAKECLYVGHRLWVEKVLIFFSERGPPNFFPLISSAPPPRQLMVIPLKVNECKIDQWLKILWSRIELFGFLKAVMAVSNPFMKLNSAYADEASLWTSRCRIHQKSHLRSCLFKVWSLLTTQLLKMFVVVIPKDGLGMTPSVELYFAAFTDYYIL